MTLQEAIEKYGDVELKFSDYYKYSFGFYGQNDDVEITASRGDGSSDNIYKFKISRDQGIPFRKVDYMFHWAEIKDKKSGKIVFAYDDRY